jgi:hypothetical protein
VSDTQNTHVAADDQTRRSLVELKRGITELKLEALRRGYGIESDPAGAIDDFDAIAEEAARNIERRQRGPGPDRGIRAPHDLNSTPSWA